MIPRRRPLIDDWIRRQLFGQQGCHHVVQRLVHGLVLLFGFNEIGQFDKLGLQGNPGIGDGMSRDLTVTFVTIATTLLVREKKPSSCDGIVVDKHFEWTEFLIGEWLLGAFAVSG